MNDDPCVSERLDDYLEALSSPDPTPGGGSAAATIGAIGCALAEMTCAITLQRPDAAEAPALAAAASTFRSARERLRSLAQDDAEAYQAYVEARTLPRSTDDERAVRRAAMQQALHGAASVPLDTVACAADALETLASVVHLVSRHVRADVATSAHALTACGLGAAANVRANLSLIRDEHAVRRFDERLSDDLRRLEVARSRAIDADQVPGNVE